MAKRKKELTAGAAAPDFSLPTDGDDAISLSGLRGQSVVLYFYPKDDTAGCTKEAIEFSAAQKSFARAGAVIIGVSKDSVAKHAKFRKNHGLTIALGADEEGITIAEYGAWVEKTLYGRKYMGIDRSTFLIDSQGVIRGVWRKVRVPGHVDEVLEAAKAIRPPK